MLSSFSHTFITNIANLKILHISNNNSLIMKNRKVLGTLEESLIFLVPQDLNFKASFITKSLKSSSILSELSNKNEKNLIHGPVTATISKSST